LNIRLRNLSKNPFFRFALWLSIFIFFIGIAWAGIRSDVLGNIIKSDVVAPAGGKRITDGNGNVINASAGQCAVGLSQSASGRKLYHGVHSPVISPTQVHNWQAFEK
jgi:hypothetical protein